MKVFKEKMDIKLGVGNSNIGTVIFKRYSVSNLELLQRKISDAFFTMEENEGLIVKYKNSFIYTRYPADNYYSLLITIVDFFEQNIWGNTNQDQLRFKKTIYDAFVKSILIFE